MLSVSLWVQRSGRQPSVSVLSIRELSLMAVGFEISVTLLCGRHLLELQ